MTLIPLAIPPGIYANGTEFQASGRWYDGSLVRWVDGTMQPVGGWTELDDEGTAAPRGMHAWRDLSGNRRYAFGTYSELIAITGGSVSDITPAGFVQGTEDAEQNTGYGGGAYGFEAYGVTRADAGGYGEAASWSIDNWGEDLVACCTSDGRILTWDLAPAGVAAAVSGAPTGCVGLVVTEERFLFALGAGGNPRLVKWSDREDNTTWVASAENEAGDLELQTTGQIQLGIRTRGQALILTDHDAHAATYQGPPFVYGFERVGSACGAVSRHCAAAVDAGVFWMGERGFFRYSGGAVETIACDVLDWVTTNINSEQRSKVCAVSNAQFGEIWWFFPQGEENDSYVTLNYREGHWSKGSLARTSGVDRGVYQSPIWAAPDGKTYTHESGQDRGTETIFAETGPISLGNGDQTMGVTMLYPDERTGGQVTATFKARFYPNDTERNYGPYSLDEPTPVRFSGRQIRMRINGTEADWRVGTMRVDVTVRGKR